jgi:excisionase family DNA binding protein
VASEYSADFHTFGLDRALYPVTAALTILSVSRSTFYSLVDQGELELVKLGRRSLVTAPSIAAFLARLSAREFADRKIRSRASRSKPPIDARVLAEAAK